MNVKLIAECTDYDFKLDVELAKPKSWLKSVSAFSNSSGGALFFGVDDDGKCVGLNDIGEKISKMTELIKTRIEPIPVFEIKLIEEKGISIIEVKITQGRSTPYYYHADGQMIAFVRMGDESIESPKHIMDELILKGKGQTYDSIITGENVNDFAFSILRSKYKIQTGFKLEESDFASFGLSNNNLLTRAGILLADENRVLQSRIFCTRWNGTDKVNEREVVDDIEISGSLLTQFDQAFNFYKKNTRSGWHKEEGDTIIDSEYDDEAIKEALVNAIVHRDYNIMGAEVCLNIYDDRIEITSPGAMFSGLSIPEKVDYTMESIRRNPVIADIFNRMHLMNRRGSGLSNITSKTNELFGDGMNHVFFKTKGPFFIVVIQNALYKAKAPDDFILAEKNEKEGGSLSKNENAVLQQLKKDKYLTYDKISEETGLSRRTIANIFSKLSKEGYLKRVGALKNGYWEILK